MCQPQGAQHWGPGFSFSKTGARFASLTLEKDCSDACHYRKEDFVQDHGNRGRSNPALSTTGHMENYGGGAERGAQRVENS